MMVNESDPTLTGNDRFRGLLHRPGQRDRPCLRNFSVEFDLVEGGSYGGIDPVTGKASGMVKDLPGTGGEARGHGGYVRG